MAEIENPWHSRPIDVHRWSDHPEVKALVDRIWDQYLPEEVVGKPGPKPKLSFRKLLRVSHGPYRTSPKVWTNGRFRLATQIRGFRVAVT